MVAPAEMLSALSQAFAYPWNGLEETQAALREYRSAIPACHSERSEESPTSHRGRSFGFRPQDDGEAIDAVLAAGERFADRTSAQLAYTRLFIGSFKMEAPPYASFYLGEDGTLNGWAAAEVSSVYAQFGLELDPGEKAPADHLRYLLAFLALLAARWEETGEAAFAEAYADFRDDYVLSWIGRFAERVERYAEEPYYPVLVAFIVNVLEGEESALGNSL